MSPARPTSASRTSASRWTRASTSCSRGCVAAGGTPVTPEPVAIDRGANAGGRALYVRDPDGHVLELFEPPAPVSTLDPISAPGLADTIAERLRTAIQTGVYPPGTRLPERPMAAELGVSHIPVREALARLAEEGLVDREPRRGARVAALTARQLDEISSLRIVLEQFVARRVQAVWTPTIERQLRARGPRHGGGRRPRRRAARDRARPAVPRAALGSSPSTGC